MDHEPLISYDISHLEQCIDDGWTPVWSAPCGPVGEYPAPPEYLDVIRGPCQMLMKLARGRLRTWIVVKLPIAGDVIAGKHLVRKLRSVHGVSRPGITSSTKGEQAVARVAAILGIGSFCRPGLGIKEGLVPPADVTIAGLDIEVRTGNSPGSGWPLALDDILSIAVSAPDGQCHVCYTTGRVTDPGLLQDKRMYLCRVNDSAAAVAWAIGVVECMEPDVLAVHNGLSFDLPRLAAHCPVHLRNRFTAVNLDASRQGVTMNLRGVNLVDTYHYLDKLHRQEWQGTSLTAVAERVGLPRKLSYLSPSFSPSSNDPIDALILYNAHDAWLHAGIARLTGCVNEICTVAGCLKAPMTDASRFISGTMVSNLASSHVLSTGYVFDWAPEDVDQDGGKYRGAWVLDPVPGVHGPVAVCDVSSMYPTIMRDLNVSMETETHRHVPGYERTLAMDHWPGPMTFAQS
ncbi:unnamed protein product [Closterium sp. NIES-53]